MARALRAGLTVAVTGLAVVLPASAARSAAVFYQAQTAATAVHLTLTQKPASSIITASLVDDAAAYAAGAFDSSGGSEAQGASLYPGRLVVQGPALFCSLVIDCPVAPPDYPLLASASWPRTPRSTASANQRQVGSGPVVVTPAQWRAVAADGSNNASTATGRVSVLAGTPVAVSMAAS